ncbi:MAG: IclR family transcriptional regulator [Aeromicrobium sp.]|uniref:IclR family transcriptional regulator n=1 Tax=Aeromicrobium sp. TaxID=1871063 RepID=UPI0039E2E054
MSPSQPTRSGGIQSVERAARVLRAVADHQQMTITDIAAALEVHKSTASRLVATLVAEGLLDGGGSGPIRLGPELRRLGRAAAGEADLAEIARGPLERLSEATGETATLAVRDGDYAVTVAQSGGTHRVGVRSWVGARTPLALTADGKALLAFGDEQPPSLPTSLRAELDRVRTRERAFARGELEENLYGVAVPVVEKSGRCLGAVCVSGPSYRVTTERFEPLADRCRATAYEILDLRRQHREHTP